MQEKVSFTGRSSCMEGLLGTPLSMSNGNAQSMGGELALGVWYGPHSIMSWRLKAAFAGRVPGRVVGGVAGGGGRYSR